MNIVKTIFYRSNALIISINSYLFGFRALCVIFVDNGKSLLVDKTFNKQNVLSRTEFWTRQGSLGQ